MTDARSTHLPEVSGGKATVTGTLVVDTQLRNVQTVIATLGEDQSADAGGVSVTWADPVGGATSLATISVWEDDNTTPSTAAVVVNWLALGK